MGARVGQDLEGDGQQRVPRQHRRHFVKSDMGGGAAAAQIVIVHARQIVMHQRIGMQRLDRRPHPQGTGIVHPEQACGMQHQERAEALAPRHDGVAHGLLDPGLAPLRTGQDRVQGGVHKLCGYGNGLGEAADIRPGWGRPVKIIGHDALFSLARDPFALAGS